MIEQSSLYPKSYGVWAGNREGHPPDYTRCCATVSSHERWSRCYQCKKPRGHGPDGAYCKQHDPDAVKARRDASEARWNESWKKRRYEIHGHAFFDALVKIADGHNDPRSLARQTIDEFKKGERG